MQLFDRLVEAWPERTIVPSLAERWEIAPDGLRYVFHLRDDHGGNHAGNVSEVEIYRTSIADALPSFERGETDLILVRYTPRLADLMPGAVRPDAVIGPAAWSAYLRFDHTHPVTGSLELR